MTVSPFIKVKAKFLRNFGTGQQVHGGKRMAEQDLSRIVAENICTYLKESGKTQRSLAEYMKVSQATVSGWCKGLKIPRADKIDGICAFFGVNRFQLFEDSRRARQYTQAVRIPVFAFIRGRVPMERQEEIADWEEIPPEMAFRGEFFALQVRGDQMEPKFSENDVAIVQKQEDAESGSLVVVSAGGRDAVIRKMIKYPDGGIALIPSNPVYPPVRFTGEEIKKRRVRVFGRVVELRAKF